MSKTFKLTAAPGILHEGGLAGHMETVHFLSESEAETHKWSAVNTGRLVDEFGELVSAELASHIVTRLQDGETVELPNRYELGEVKGKFKGR